MQISRRKYNRARKGTIEVQAAFRGVTTRRMLASIKVETCFRKYCCRKNFKMLKSAVIALQCRTRVKIAKKEMKGLMGEQKDIGKLKENNERLKMEMNSLKAMLAAQAKEDASNLAHTRELEVKQAEITQLEKRVVDLEKQLAEEKAVIQKLEADLKNQREQASLNSTNHGHGHHHKRSGVSPSVAAAAIDVDAGALQMPNLPSNYVSPEVLAKHKNHLAMLEEELRAERQLRREADGEIIKLRAAINGVQLNESEVNDLLAQKLQDRASATGSLRYVFPLIVSDLTASCRPLLLQRCYGLPRVVQCFVLSRQV
jgi:myosin heavy subunit